MTVTKRRQRSVVAWRDVQAVSVVVVVVVVAVRLHRLQRLNVRGGSPWRRNFLNCIGTDSSSKYFLLPMFWVSPVSFPAFPTTVINFFRNFAQVFFVIYRTIWIVTDWRRGPLPKLMVRRTVQCRIVKNPIFILHWITTRGFKNAHSMSFNSNRTFHQR